MIIVASRYLIDDLKPLVYLVSWRYVLCNRNKDLIINIDVYDTNECTTEGDVLHFDVLLPSGEGDKATQHARDWQQSIGMNSGVTSLGHYGYCHTESATPDILCQIHDHGHFSIQLEGFPAATF